MLIEIILEAWDRAQAKLDAQFSDDARDRVGNRDCDSIDRLWQQLSQCPGAWLRRIRQERGHLLAAADQPEQPGGQRQQGKKSSSSRPDMDMVKQTAPLVKHVVSRETVRRPGIAYGDRLVGTASRAGCLSGIWRDAE